MQTTPAYRRTRHFREALARLEFRVVETGDCASALEDIKKSSKRDEQGFWDRLVLQETLTLAMVSPWSPVPQTA